MSAKRSGSSIFSDAASPSNARWCESLAYCSKSDSTFAMYSLRLSTSAGRSGIGSTATDRYSPRRSNAMIRPRRTPSTITLM